MKVERRRSHESPEAKHLQRWVVVARKGGKPLGIHKSREAALRQLAAIKADQKTR